MMKLRQIMAVLFVFLMFLCAIILNEREIIFPEILAVLIGAWIMPRQPWNVSKPRMIVVMSLSAMTGIVISQYVPFGLYEKVIIGLIFAFLYIIISRTTMVPLISACVLPIMMGTTSIVYPISVMVMVLLIVCIQEIFQKIGINIDRTYVKEQMDLIVWFKRLLALAVFLFLPLHFGYPYFAVPPLIVAFVEISEKKSPVRGRWKELFLIIGCAALLGAFARYFIKEQSSVFLLIGGISVTILLFVLMYVLKFYFPPAGAVAMLPFLLPAQGIFWYPLEVLIGFLILAFLAELIVKSEIIVIHNKKYDTNLNNAKGLKKENPAG